MRGAVLRGAALSALLLWAAAGAAAAEAVSAVELYRQGDGVYCTVTLRELFPEPIANTLRSGLPVVFDLGVEVTADGRGTVAASVLRSEVDYDVWDGVFFLRRREATREFADFEAMRAAAVTVERFRLCGAADLPADADFRLGILLEISPLSAEAQGRMSRWVARTVSQPGEQTSRELRLNLGGLIGGIFDADADEILWGGRSESGPWRLDRLPVRSAPEDAPANPDREETP